MALIIFAPLYVLVGLTLSAPVYPVPLTSVVLTPIPENIYNHVQDTKSGEYAFGYAGGPVAREEARSSDGVTRGAYSYVDAHGIVQYYRYVADDDGFRIVGTNIPTDVASNPQVQSQQDQQLLEVMNIMAAEILPEESAEIASSRKKRSAVNSEIPMKTINALSAVPLKFFGDSSVPMAISSQSPVQIHDSLRAEVDRRIETIPIQTVVAVPATSVAVPVSVKSIEAIPVAVAASIPTATSSQSRFQIHKSLKTEIHVPVEAISVQKEAAVSETPVAAPVSVKSIEAIPVAVAASIPTATSSQSRFQIHKNLKTEIYDPVETISIQTVTAVPETPLVVPVSVKSIEAIPVAAAAPVPTATSSQSRFQVHKSLNAEIHVPVEAISEQKGAAVPETPVAAPVSIKSIEAIPVAVAASIPTATSSQSRFQVHKGLKMEIYDPVETISIQTVAAVPETPIAVPVSVKSNDAIPVAVAASAPTATSSQSHLQIHDSVKTVQHESSASLADATVTSTSPVVAALPVETKMIPAAPIVVAESVATSTSNHKRFQVHNSASLEYKASPQSLRYNVVALQPVIAHLQHDNEFSLPFLMRHQVGVGLGVVPSPAVVYPNYETALFA